MANVGIGLDVNNETRMSFCAQLTVRRSMEVGSIVLLNPVQLLVVLNLVN